jgi:hypothetical protein
MGAFGAVIPVTGLNNGFLGQVSRTGAGEPLIVARLANASNKNNIVFGDPVVLQQDSTGGTYTQVKDFITNNSGLVTPTRAPIVPVTNVLPFAGFAVREVKTYLGYPLPPGTSQVGYYAAGQMCEVLERGSICVSIPLGGTAYANGQVYLRILVDSGSAGTLGDLEASADVALATTMTASAIGTSLTVASYTNVANGQYVSGLGIAPGTFVTNVNTNTITINQNTVGIIAAGTPVTFSYTIPLPDVVFRTGVIDSNNVAEVTIINRVAG